MRQRLWHGGGIRRGMYFTRSTRRVLFPCTGALEGKNTKQRFHTRIRAQHHRGETDSLKFTGVLTLIGPLGHAVFILLFAS
jgi:hypothetical protein